MSVETARIINVKRTTSVEDASLVIGDLVEDKKPSFNDEIIAYDQDTGELVAAVINLPRNSTTQRARETIKEMAFTKMSRAQIYSSDSTTFGYAPRRPSLQREGCNSTSNRRDNPHIEKALEDLADTCHDILNQFAPDLINNDRKILEAVKEEWKIGEQKLWTSGVVNDTARLPYHRDNFNFPAYSAMPVFRYKAKGGYLHIPEYDLTLPCRDNTVAYFKGKELVHGVTPIKRTAEDAFRYSIVYYALQGMKDCLTHAQETQYAQTRRSQRELDMARRIAAGNRKVPTSKNIQKD